MVAGRGGQGVNCSASLKACLRRARRRPTRRTKQLKSCPARAAVSGDNHHCTGK